jgi:hypothetical protein
MSTECMSSVKSSVMIVAFPVKLLWNADELYFVRKVVGDYCGISSEATVKRRRTVFRPQSRRWWLWHFRWSYCEMPMDCISSAKSSVTIVAFPLKLPWNADGLYSFESRRWWLWHFQWSYCEMSTNCIPSTKSSVMIVAFPVKLLWNADGLYFVSMNVGDSALCKKDYVCSVYLPSCKHLNYKLSIAQNNNNNA